MISRRVIAVSLMLWIAAAAAAFVASPHGAWRPRRVERLTRAIPAAGINDLDLDEPGGPGAIDMRASEAGTPDVIDVELFVQAGSAIPFISKPAADIGDAALNSIVNGERVSLAVSGLADSRPSSIKAQWTIRVPARLSVHVAANSSRITLMGVEGAIVAEVGAGSIRAEVPNQRRGALDLETSVGRSSLRLAGEEIGGSREFGPGSHVHLRGAPDAHDGITLHASVGDTRLIVVR